MPRASLFSRLRFIWRTFNFSSISLRAHAYAHMHIRAHSRTDLWNHVNLCVRRAACSMLPKASPEHKLENKAVWSENLTEGGKHCHKRLFLLRMSVKRVVEPSAHPPGREESPENYLRPRSWSNQTCAASSATQKCSEDAQTRC